MRLHVFSRCRWLLLLVAMIAAAPGTSRSDVSIPASEAQTELAKAPYEVRLRKLHLVRPDLIPFPIFFEVYC
jgi:hypothetical protein